MKYYYRGLIEQAARKMSHSEAGTAYALYELADNIGVLLRGECSIDEFKRAYDGFDDPPFIRGGLMPGEAGYDQQEDPAPPP